MKKHTITTTTLAWAALSLSACGAEAPAASGPPPVEPPSESDSSTPRVGLGRTAEVLNEFSVGDASYVMAAAPRETVAMMARGPSRIGPLPHERLMAQYGRLTLLETYLALAPTGEPPSERLVAYHDMEVDIMGRPDHSVLAVTFDPSFPVVEKDFWSPCVDAALQYVFLPSWNWVADYYRVVFYDGDGTRTTTSSQQPQSMAVCENFGRVWTINSGYRAGNNSYTWFGWTDMQPHTMAVVYWGFTAFDKNLRSDTVGFEDLEGVVGYAKQI